MTAKGSPFISLEQNYDTISKQQVSFPCTMVAFTEFTNVLDVYFVKSKLQETVDCCREGLDVRRSFCYCRCGNRSSRVLRRIFGSYYPKNSPQHQCWGFIIKWNS
ncbi:uncharacterized protein LOC143187641 isoform X2 [Calliopsis andreniformis]|uniref:uncharacterized protein LOC143187641 isoform X2 n=1 Tax=Calliopsis andreniformis TaxID=337506 RepID=UPI003FCEDD45